METTPFQALISIGLFGVLVGTVSALTSVSRNLDAVRIPEFQTPVQQLCRGEPQQLAADPDLSVPFMAMGARKAR